jgi:ACS family sodium-dependent inorganic phosphate cotransporter
LLGITDTAETCSIAHKQDISHTSMPAAFLQDLSPKYASALLGITNTAGAIPGVLGVTSAGYLLDATSSWQWALFFPTAAFQLMGAVFYSIFASSERQHWS